MMGQKEGISVGCLRRGEGFSGIERRCCALEVGGREKRTERSLTP